MGANGWKQYVGKASQTESSREWTTGAVSPMTHDTQSLARGVPFESGELPSKYQRMGMNVVGNSNADIKTLERLYAIICEQPGITINELSKATGLQWASIQARLITMANHGFVLTECPKAGLYPFEEVERR